MTDAVPGAAAADLAMPATPAEQAAAKIIELKNNPEWVKRHVDGDHATQAEMRKLHELAFQPAPGSIIDGGPTSEAQWVETAAHLEATADLSAGVIAEIKAGLPASALEYKAAIARKNSRMRDPQWVSRYMAGGPEREEMLLLISIISRGMRLA